MGFLDRHRIPVAAFLWCHIDMDRLKTREQKDMKGILNWDVKRSNFFGIFMFVMLSIFYLDRFLTKAS
jgi:hypothetical protein